MTCGENQERTEVCDSFLERQTSFCADDAVITSINEPDGYVPCPDDIPDEAQPWTEAPHDRPAGIKVLTDLYIVDVAGSELINAGVDAIQGVPDPEEEEKPAGVSHCKAEKAIAGACLGSQPVPGIHPEAVGCQQYQFTYLFRGQL